MNCYYTLLVLNNYQAYHSEVGLQIIVHICVQNMLMDKYISNISDNHIDPRFDPMYLINHS